MADAAISVLLDRLAPVIEKNVRREVSVFLNPNVEAELLSSKLKKIQQVLMDAEQNGVMDPKVRNWLEKLQDISYDIDALLDEWELQNLKEAEEVNSSDSWLKKKVRSFLPSVYVCFKQNIKRRTIARNIRKLNERLDLIAEENDKEFKFIPNLNRPESPDFKRIITTSFVDVSEVKGRGDDRKIVTEMLLPEKCRDGVEIVSIVGAGGMGKTTLAQLVFNDERVKVHFDVKIWVCVSDPFDGIKIAKAILESRIGSSWSASELETLVQSVKDYISGKRFLLVLDDVWTEDDTMWKPLKICLMKNGVHGSRILVTTRNRKVAATMGSTQSQVHRLNPLSDSYCWSLLSKIAFHERSDGECEMLKNTGWEIALKCKGLPLAAKTLGSLLRFKTRLQEWEAVLKSEMWELEKVRKDLFPVLALSYNELSPASKRCFSYCAIFPKDFLINVDDLIRDWMAQGFLSKNESSGEMEQQGRDFFNDLAMRSFFQEFDKDPYVAHLIVSCKMHDIVHDFAQFLTKNECLIVERVAGEREREVFSSRNILRHLTLMECDGKITKDLLSNYQTETLLSFLCLENEIPLNLLNQLKRVRLLRLRGCNLGDLPWEIGNLIHLRYLDMSRNFELKKLPESICDLYNLQTLNLQYCYRLLGLPHGIHKLMNLRHLLNDSTRTLLDYPQGFERLYNLQTLEEFRCGRESNHKLGYLKDLNRLGGSLYIYISDLDDDEYENVLEAEKAELKNKKSIHHLGIICKGKVGLKVIDAMQPPSNLESFLFSGISLPNWVATLTNLKKLEIRNVGNGIDKLNSLRNLPFLEGLSLFGLKMEHLSIEFFGINRASTDEIVPQSAFPKLKILRFVSCYEWKEWEDMKEEDKRSSILPCLKNLDIIKCHGLKELPHCLLRNLSLQALYIESCRSLEERYKKGTGELWDQISHIPSVTFK